MLGRRLQRQESQQVHPGEQVVELAFDEGEQRGGPFAVGSGGGGARARAEELARPAGGGQVDRLACRREVEPEPAGHGISPEMDGDARRGRDEHETSRVDEQAKPRPCRLGDQIGPGQDHRVEPGEAGGVEGRGLDIHDVHAGALTGGREGEPGPGGGLELVDALGPCKAQRRDDADAQGFAEFHGLAKPVVGAQSVVIDARDDQARCAGSGRRGAAGAIGADGDDRGCLFLAGVPADRGSLGGRLVGAGSRAERRQPSADDGGGILRGHRAGPTQVHANELGELAIARGPAIHKHRTQGLDADDADVALGRGGGGERDDADALGQLDARGKRRRCLGCVACGRTCALGGIERSFQEVREHDDEGPIGPGSGLTVGRSERGDDGGKRAGKVGLAIRGLDGVDEPVERAEVRRRGHDDGLRGRAQGNEPHAIALGSGRGAKRVEHALGGELVAIQRGASVRVAGLGGKRVVDDQVHRPPAAPRPKRTQQRTTDRKRDECEHQTATRQQQPLLHHQLAALTLVGLK